MTNILQLNSRKGLVQLSPDDLAELNLLKWIRTSFRGIGRAGFIEETPFEQVAADLYVQKYPDTQVDLATRCILEPDGSVTVMLRTFSGADNKYFNTADNEIVITKHETKQAKFFHRERKKKFNSLKKRIKSAIYSGDFGGGQVQTLTPISSSDGNVSYQVGTTKNTVSISKAEDGTPIINGWPDVKGVDIYPNDVVLLISDFSGFVGHSNLRSPEMPSYEKLINEPEGKFYSKFPASRSYLNDFDKTMILLDLTSRRKGDIDFTRLYIDDDIWSQKYRDKINESLYGQFSFNTYKEFVSFLNDINFSSASNQIVSNTDDNISAIANSYDKKSLFNELLGSIDLRDTYINHMPSVMQLMANPKNSNKIKTVAMEKVGVPAYLKDALSDVFKSDPETHITEDYVPTETLLATIQDKFTESNLKRSYETVKVHLAEVILKKELEFILKYLSSEQAQIQSMNNQVGNTSSVDYTALLDPERLQSLDVAEDYTSFIIDQHPELSPNSSIVSNYNRVINYLLSAGAISSIEEVEEISAQFNSGLKSKGNISKTLDIFNYISKDNISTQEGVSYLQGIIDFLINFDNINKKEFTVNKEQVGGEFDTPTLETISFDDKPFKFIDNYISNFSNIYKESAERKFVNFNALPKAEKEDALESIGYGKEPMSVEEFMTRCPDAREYENLWITNWTNSSAEDKAKRLKEAFDLDREVNPDFSSTLFGDEQSGLRGVNKFKEKALLDFHKWKMENEGADKPLNLVSTDRDNPEEYRQSKQEFRDWMKEYSLKQKENLANVKAQKENAVQQLSSSQADPNFNVDKQKQLISYYDDTIKEIEDASLTTWEDYLNFTNKGSEASEGTVEGRKTNEKRELVKVIGFTTYDDVTLPDNIDRISDYVKDYIIDTYHLNPEYDSSDIDKLLQAEIGHLKLESIKAHLVKELGGEMLEEESLTQTIEGIPASYEGFRSTITNLYNKLGIVDPSSETPDSLMSKVDLGKKSGSINGKESVYLVNLVKAAKSYVSNINQEFSVTLDSIDEQIASYNENVTEDTQSLIESLLAQREEVEAEINKVNNLYGYIFSTIPDEIISQYSLLQIDPNLQNSSISGEDLITNISEGRLPTKSAALENALSSIDADYSSYLMRPEVIDFIQKRLPSIGMKKDLDALVNQIAPEVQKEYINQYVENNPEIFGKGFIEDQGFDATTSNQDIWAVVSLLNADASKEGLYLVTPDQLLKVDAQTIDTFYDKEVKVKNKGKGDFDNSGFVPFFTSDKDRENYNNNSYQKALNDYKDTEKYLDSQSAMKGVKDSKNTGIDLSSEYTDVDKYKAGPIENYKSQVTKYRAELENLPSIKKDVDRLEQINQMLETNVEDSAEYNALVKEQAVLTNYVEPILKKKKLLEKKIEEAKKNIEDYKPAYSAEDQIKEKTTKLKKDISAYNDLVLKYKNLSESSPNAVEEISRIKNILLKKKEMIDIQKKSIDSLKQEPNKKGPSVEEPVSKNTLSDEEEAQRQEELLNRRREIQPNKYHHLINKFYKTADIKAMRKIHWLNRALESEEETLLNNYIKVASSNVETYNSDGSINLNTTPGSKLDVKEKSFKSKPDFDQMVDEAIRKNSSYTGEQSFYNDNSQVSTDLLDGDLETEEPTSNDTSTITSKRVSSFEERESLIERIKDFIEAVQETVDEIMLKDIEDATEDEIGFMEEYTSLLECLENLLNMDQV